MSNNPDLVKLGQELIKAGIIKTVAPDTCWLDGSCCPYGLPEGTFEKRPMACFMGKNGCRKLKDHKSDLIQFSNLIIAEESERQLQEAFDKSGVTLSSEVAMLANDEYEISDLEKIILITGAKIIEREEKSEDRAPIDSKIIRKKDFELKYHANL